MIFRRMWFQLFLLTIFIASNLWADDTLQVGAFTKIYDPSVGEAGSWYINDHCFVMGGDGVWHMFGITHAEPMNPLDEDNLAHATAQKLTQVPWQKQSFALSVEAKWKEEHLWAPHVIFHQGLYYMYYCAGAKDHTKYKIHLATSKDLKTWERHKKNPIVVDGYDARDPFVIKIKDRWYMYFTATNESKGGNHVVFCVSSTDLIRWQNKITVFFDPKKGTYGGPTESPFIVRRGPWYYLFIGPRGGYDGTDVFRSKDPFGWEAKDKVGHINSHAAEVIRDRDGKWYVSRCGWKRGGLYLAPLTWNDNQDDNDTSLPIPKARKNIKK